MEEGDVGRRTVGPDPLPIILEGSQKHLKLHFECTEFNFLSTAGEGGGVLSSKLCQQPTKKGRLREDVLSSKFCQPEWGRGRWKKVSSFTFQPAKSFVLFIFCKFMFACLYYYLRKVTYISANLVSSSSNPPSGLKQTFISKLRKIDISGNFFSVSEDMYDNNFLNVKMKPGFTQPFASNIGVRQGDTLSPHLVKIFINDLPDVFDNDCYGVDVGTYHLNCLLYADYVILLSRSEAGLQRCIAKLEQYCNEWCLEVNFYKSKVLIFIKTGKLYTTSFTYKGRKVECVKEYKYFGVTFCASGIFSSA